MTTVNPLEPPEAKRHPFVQDSNGGPLMLRQSLKQECICGGQLWLIQVLSVEKGMARIRVHCAKCDFTDLQSIQERQIHPAILYPGKL